MDFSPSPHERFRNPVAYFEKGGRAYKNPHLKKSFLFGLADGMGLEFGVMLQCCFLLRRLSEDDMGPV